MTKKRNLLLACGLAIMACGVGHAEARSAADQELLTKAIASCNGPQYPSGARPVVNYGQGTFQCVEPGSTRR